MESNVCDCGGGTLHEQASHGGVDTNGHTSVEEEMELEKASSSSEPGGLKLDSKGLPLVPQPSIFKDDPLVSTVNFQHVNSLPPQRFLCRSPTRLLQTSN
jgi:hypothetical protein